MLALLLLVVAAVQVEATFAASVGFSGRNADCSTCHAPVGEAMAHLDGVPEQWRPGESYALAPRVTGGPAAAPDPQPKGGFELEAEAGRLAPGPGMQGLLRFPAPTTATYEPEGTLHRAWAVDWTAPPAHEPPAEVRLWLAVVSANGNHVIATNISDGGEQGDAVDTLVVTIPPAPDVVAAWEALPLSAPVVERIERTADGVRIVGRHTDANATHLGTRIGESAWRASVTEDGWSVLTDEDTLPLLSIRSEGTGRVSEAVVPAPAATATPWPFALLLPALAWAARVK